MSQSGAGVSGAGVSGAGVAPKQDEAKVEKKTTPLHKRICEPPKGKTWAEYVEGRKRNPMVEKESKKLLKAAQAQIRKGAKKVTIMAGGNKVEATVETKGENYALLRVGKDETYGIEL